MTESDLDPLLHLCARDLPLDPWSTRVLRRVLFDDPRIDPRLTLVTDDPRRTGGVAGCAVGLLRENEAGRKQGWLKMWVVHERYRGEGLGRALLAELERRLAGAGATEITTTGAPYYLWPGVDLRYTAASCLLEKLGYEARTHHVNMEVDLTGRDFDTSETEARLAADGYHIHRSTPEAIDRVAAFCKGQGWAVWSEEVPIASTNDPTSLFHAEQEGEVVAFAAYDCGMFAATFGPMATHLSLRGKGIGRVLLDRCLADMKRLGHRRCEIAWVGPVRFYAKAVDARIHRVFREYVKAL